MKSTSLAVAAFALLTTFSTVASANDADFRLVNKTGYQIDNVYVSRASSKNWGSDIMGKDAIGDGSAVNITFPHGGSVCSFDIKVNYADGDTAEWSGVDLCKFETISLYWDGTQTRAVGE